MNTRKRMMAVIAEAEPFPVPTYAKTTLNTQYSDFIQGYYYLERHNVDYLTGYTLQRSYRQRSKSRLGYNGNNNNGWGNFGNWNSFTNWTNVSGGSAYTTNTAYIEDLTYAPLTIDRFYQRESRFRYKKDGIEGEFITILGSATGPLTGPTESSASASEPINWDPDEGPP